MLNLFRDILKEELNPIKERLIKVEKQQEENTQILRSLLENSETHNARLDNIDNKMAHLEGNIKKVNSKTDLALANAAQNRIDISQINSK